MPTVEQYARSVHGVSDTVPVASLTPIDPLAEPAPGFNPANPVPAATQRMDPMAFAPPGNAFAPPSAPAAAPASPAAPVRMDPMAFAPPGGAAAEAFPAVSQGPAVVPPPATPTRMDPMAFGPSSTPATPPTTTTTTAIPPGYAKTLAATTPDPTKPRPLPMSQGMLRDSFEKRRQQLLRDMGMDLYYGNDRGQRILSGEHDPLLASNLKELQTLNWSLGDNKAPTPLNPTTTPDMISAADGWRAIIGKAATGHAEAMGVGGPFIFDAEALDAQVRRVVTRAEPTVGAALQARLNEVRAVESMLAEAKQAADAEAHAGTPILTMPGYTSKAQEYLTLVLTLAPHYLRSQRELFNAVANLEDQHVDLRGKTMKLADGSVVPITRYMAMESARNEKGMIGPLGKAIRDHVAGHYGAASAQVLDDSRIAAISQNAVETAMQAQSGLIGKAVMAATDPEGMVSEANAAAAEENPLTMGIAKAAGGFASPETVATYGFAGKAIQALRPITPGLGSGAALQAAQRAFVNEGLTMAAGGMASSALNQAIEKGKVDPNEVLHAGAEGLAVGGLTHGAIKVGEKVLTPIQTTGQIARAGGSAMERVGKAVEGRTELADAEAGGAAIRKAGERVRQWGERKAPTAAEIETGSLARNRAERQAISDADRDILNQAVKNKEFTPDADAAALRAVGLSPETDWVDQDTILRQARKIWQGHAEDLPTSVESQEQLTRTARALQYIDARTEGGLSKKPTAAELPAGKKGELQAPAASDAATRVPTPSPQGSATDLSITRANMAETFANNLPKGLSKQDMESLATSLGLSVKYQPTVTAADGRRGHGMVSGNLIHVATEGRDDAQQRWTLAHEIGHYISHRAPKFDVPNGETQAILDAARKARLHPDSFQGETELRADVLRLYLHDPEATRKLAPEATKNLEASLAKTNFSRLVTKAQDVDAPKPEWVTDEENRRFEVAKKAGVVEQIEELSAQGKTANEIARAIGSKLAGDGLDRKGIIRAVRNKLGIPSMDQRTEFEAWLKKRGEKRQGSGASSPSERGAGDASNAKGAGTPAAPPATVPPQTGRTGSQITEPPAPAPGMVRFYHGGADYTRGNRWLSPDRKYAEGYARQSGGKVFYVDVPEGSPNLSKAFDDSGTNMKAPYTSFEAPEEIARGLKELPATQEQPNGTTQVPARNDANGVPAPAANPPLADTPGQSGSGTPGGNQPAANGPQPDAKDGGTLQKPKQIADLNRLTFEDMAGEKATAAPASLGFDPRAMVHDLTTPKSHTVADTGEIKKTPAATDVAGMEVILDHFEELAKRGKLNDNAILGSQELQSLDTPTFTSLRKALLQDPAGTIAAIRKALAKEIPERHTPADVKDAMTQEGVSEADADKSITKLQENANAPAQGKQPGRDLGQHSGTDQGGTPDETGNRNRLPDGGQETPPTLTETGQFGLPGLDVEAKATSAIQKMLAPFAAFHGGKLTPALEQQYLVAIRLAQEVGRNAAKDLAKDWTEYGKPEGAGAIGDEIDEYAENFLAAEFDEKLRPKVDGGDYVELAQADAIKDVAKAEMRKWLPLDAETRTQLQQENLDNTPTIKQGDGKLYITPETFKRYAKAAAAKRAGEMRSRLEGDTAELSDRMAKAKAAQRKFVEGVRLGRQSSNLAEIGTPAMATPHGRAGAGEPPDPNGPGAAFDYEGWYPSKGTTTRFQRMASAVRRFVANLSRDRFKWITATWGDGAADLRQRASELAQAPVGGRRIGNAAAADTLKGLNPEQKFDFLVLGEHYRRMADNMLAAERILRAAVKPFDMPDKKGGFDRHDVDVLHQVIDDATDPKGKTMAGAAGRLIEGNKILTNLTDHPKWGWMADKAARSMSPEQVVEAVRLGVARALAKDTSAVDALLEKYDGDADRLMAMDKMGSRERDLPPMEIIKLQGQLAEGISRMVYVESLDKAIGDHLLEHHGQETVDGWRESWVGRVNDPERPINDRRSPQYLANRNASAVRLDPADVSRIEGTPEVQGAIERWNKDSALFNQNVRKTWKMPENPYWGEFPVVLNYVSEGDAPSLYGDTAADGKDRFKFTRENVPELKRDPEAYLSRIVSGHYQTHAERAFYAALTGSPLEIPEQDVRHVVGTDGQDEKYVATVGGREVKVAKINVNPFDAEKEDWRYYDARLVDELSKLHPKDRQMSTWEKVLGVWTNVATKGGAAMHIRRILGISAREMARRDVKLANFVPFGRYSEAIYQMRSQYTRPHGQALQNVLDMLGTSGQRLSHRMETLIEPHNKVVQAVERVWEFEEEVMFSRDGVENLVRRQMLEAALRFHLGDADVDALFEKVNSGGLSPLLASQRLMTALTPAQRADVMAFINNAAGWLNRDTRGSWMNKFQAIYPYIAVNTSTLPTGLRQAATLNMPSPKKVRDLVRQGRAKEAAALIAGALVSGIVGLWAIAQLTNRLVSGHWMWENDPKHRTHIDMGDGKYVTPDVETDRSLRLLGVKEVAAGKVHSAGDYGKAVAKEWGRQLAKNMVSPSLRGAESLAPDVGEGSVGKSVAKAIPGTWLSSTKDRIIREGFTADAIKKGMIEDLQQNVSPLPVMTFDNAASPGHRAYQSTKRLASNWAKQQGIRGEAVSNPTSSGQAMRDFFDALARGDDKGAQKALAEHKALGKDDGSLWASIHARSPLQAVPTKRRGEFMNTLSEADKDRVEESVKWYRQIRDKAVASMPPEYRLKAAISDFHEDHPGKLTPAETAQIKEMERRNTIASEARRKQKEGKIGAEAADRWVEAVLKGWKP